MNKQATMREPLVVMRFSPASYPFEHVDAVLILDRDAQGLVHLVRVLSQLIAQIFALLDQLALVFVRLFQRIVQLLVLESKPFKTLIADKKLDDLQQNKWLR